MVSFVVAMNRVDVVDLVVDLVDVDLDIDLVDVDLDVDLVDVGLVDVVLGCIGQGQPPLYFGLLAPGWISGFWPPSGFWSRKKKIKIQEESLKIIKTIEISEKNQYPNSCYHPDSILKVDF